MIIDNVKDALCIFLKQQFWSLVLYYRAVGLLDVQSALFILTPTWFKLKKPTPTINSVISLKNSQWHVAQTRLSLGGSVWFLFFVTLRFEVHFYVPCGQILLLALHFHLNSGLLTSKHTRAHKQPSGMFYLWMRNLHGVLCPWCLL